MNKQAMNDPYYPMAQILQFVKDRREFRIKEKMQEISQDRLQYIPSVTTCGVVVSGDEAISACNRLGYQANVVDISIAPFNMELAKSDLARIIRVQPIPKRALIAVRCADIWAKQGHMCKYFSRRYAAKLFEISLDSFDRANKVLKSGNEFLLDQLANNEISLTHAAEIVKVVQDTRTMSSSGMISRLASQTLQPRDLVLRLK